MDLKKLKVLADAYYKATKDITDWYVTEAKPAMSQIKSSSELADAWAAIQNACAGDATEMVDLPGLLSVERAFSLDQVRVNEAARRAQRVSAKPLTLDDVDIGFLKNGKHVNKSKVVDWSKVTSNSDGSKRRVFTPKDIELVNELLLEPKQKPLEQVVTPFRQVGSYL